MASLAGRDYQKILDLTIAVLDSYTVTAAWDAMVGELVAAMSGEVGWMYEDINFQRNTGRLCAWSPAVVGHQPLESLLRAHMPHHPLAVHLAVTDDLAPVTVHDLISDRTWRNNPARSALQATFGVTRQIVLAVPSAAGYPAASLTRRVCLISRSGKDFTLADRNFAGQVQPVLMRLDRHLGELDRLRRLAAGGADVPERRAAGIGLTPRELAVLALLAEGLTATALGHRLGISSRTAVKHLENIYRKCGTSDRLNTVLLARELGLVPVRIGPARQVKAASLREPRFSLRERQPHGSRGQGQQPGHLGPLSSCLPVPCRPNWRLGPGGSAGSAGPGGVAGLGPQPDRLGGRDQRDAGQPAERQGVGAG